MEILHVGLLILAACMITGAILDYRSRRIPNWLCLVAGICGLVFAGLFGGGSQVLWHAASMAIALVIGMGLFAVKMWGGGDGKFFAASAAWFPLAGLLGLILWISLAGLVVTIGWIAAGRLIGRNAESKKMAEVPYGIAIAVGTIGLALYSNSFEGAFVAF